MRDLGMAVIVLLVAGMLWLPAAVSQPLGIHGDFTIDPGRRVGTIVLGVSRRDVENRLGTESLEHLLLFDWQIKAKMYWWPKHAVILSFCGDKLFFAITFHATDRVSDWEWLNARTGRLRVPEGLGMSSPVEQFDHLYGPPVSVMAGLIAISGENRPFRLYANGVVLVTKPGQSTPIGIGVHDVNLCRGGKIDDRPYLPFFGRDVEIKHTVYGVKNATDCRNDSVEPAANPPRFGKNEIVCFRITLKGYRPLREDHQLTVLRPFVKPDGTVISAWLRSDGAEVRPEQPLRLEAGKSETTITFFHGGNPGREPGTWKVQVYIKAGSYQVLIATIPYELAE